MKQPVKRKKLIKYIRKLAAMLPEKTYQAAHRLGAPVFTDAEGNMYTEEMEKDGVPRRAVWRYIGEHPISHKRRMLKMWDHFHDIRALAAYMEAVGGITLSGENVEEVKERIKQQQKQEPAI